MSDSRLDDNLRKRSGSREQVQNPKRPRYSEQALGSTGGVLERIRQDRSQPAVAESEPRSCRLEIPEGEGERTKRITHLQNLLAANTAMRHVSRFLLAPDCSSEHKELSILYQFLLIGEIFSVGGMNPEKFSGAEKATTHLSQEIRLLFPTDTLRQFEIFRDTVVHEDCSVELLTTCPWIKDQRFILEMERYSADVLFVNSLNMLELFCHQQETLVSKNQKNKNLGRIKLLISILNLVDSLLRTEETAQVAIHAINTRIREIND